MVRPSTLTDSGNFASLIPKYSFNVDNCEIFAVYALGNASEGGQTLFASSSQLYNDLAREQPDISHKVAEDWVLGT